MNYIVCPHCSTKLDMPDVADGTYDWDCFFCGGVFYVQVSFNGREVRAFVKE